MLRGWKRYRLKRTIASVEDYAVKKRAWGNNIFTLILMNTVIRDYFGGLFDQTKFINQKKSLIIQSSFASLNEMIRWLNEVKLVLRDVSLGNIKELPSEKSDLNITKQYDICITDFIEHEGYPSNLYKAFQTMCKLINEIAAYHELLNPNQQKYFSMRLSMGINTCLVFHEQLLEVMIND